MDQTIKTSSTSSVYYQGTSEGSGKKIKHPKGFFIVSRLNYPITLTYDGNSIVIPPRCRKGMVKIAMLEKLSAMPKNLFLVSE